MIILTGQVQSGPALLSFGVEMGPLLHQPFHTGEMALIGTFMQSGPAITIGGIHIHLRAQFLEGGFGPPFQRR